jgi:hypothetical protein
MMRTTQDKVMDKEQQALWALQAYQGYILQHSQQSLGYGQRQQQQQFASSQGNGYHQQYPGGYTMSAPPYPVYGHQNYQQPAYYQPQQYAMPFTAHEGYSQVGKVDSRSTKWPF